MKNIFATAILVMAMIFCATMTFGDNNNGNGPGLPDNLIYIKAKLPPGAWVEYVTATITFYDVNDDPVEYPITTEYYEFDLATNTFNFYPVDFPTYWGATYAKCCVEGPNTIWGTIWYTGGKTFSIFPTVHVYSVDIQLAPGIYNCLEPIVHNPNLNN
jgi:hypothetical protein